VRLLAQAMQSVQRVRELLADVMERLPDGYSFEQLRREIDEGWDSGRGVVGSPKRRQKHPELLFAVAALNRYVKKHFGVPKGGKREVARQ